MKLRSTWWVLLGPCMGYAVASELPRPGQDYQSLQIASSTDLKAMQTLYGQHTHMPFLRLEKRGNQYTLRAGFWGTADEARRALAGQSVRGAQLRVAVLRPDALIQQNWDTGEPAVPAPVTTVHERSNRPTGQEAPLTRNAPPASGPDFSAASAILTTPPSRKLPHTVEPSPAGALRNANPEDMALAYDVLVSAGDLSSAFKIAQAAVHLLPADRSWRIKLARIAEWTQHPQIAAQQWAALFQEGARDTDTLSNITRLAWQVEDLRLPLEAWQLLAKRNPLTATQALEILKLYEELAQPAEGSMFFESQYLLRGDPVFLDYAARLAAHAGDDSRTLKLQILRSQSEPFSLSAVLDVVMMYVRSNRLSQALAFMQSHQTRIPAEASTFWRLLGEVAWDLQQVEVARNAYSNYVKSPSATNDDWARLVSLALPVAPERAASIALEAYRRFGTLPLLLQAMEIYAAAADIDKLHQTLALLQGNALVEAEKSSRFLLLRARYAQARQQPDSAWTDLRRAMELDPQNKNVGLTGLWFLIEQQRKPELAMALKHYAHDTAEADYWQPFAAANLVLERPREALFWYRRAVTRAPTDALLLLNYADALEHNQQPGMAARVRRHAWLSLQERFATDTAPSAGNKASAEWRSLLRLSLLNRPGDPALRQVRKWAAQLSALPEDRTDAETTELVLAWAISSEQVINARTWMTRTFRAQAQNQAPVWARTQVALQTSDTAAMRALLEEDRGNLPRYNRYDMERALGLHALAVDTALDGLSRNPDDEALYDRLRQHAPGQSAYLQATLKNSSASTLNTQAVSWDAQWPLRTGLAAQLGWAQSNQSTPDANLQALLPDTHRLTHLGILWSTEQQSGNLSLFQRQDWEHATGLHLDQSGLLGRGLSWRGGLDLRADSQVSPAMQIAGYEDGIRATVGLQIDKRISLQVTPGLKRFYTSLGDALGQGRALDLEATYRFRTNYPDWRLRTTLSRQDFDRSADLSAASLARLPSTFQEAVANGTITPNTYFLPESSTTLGLCLGMGDNLAGQSLQNGYSHGWRPFVDACVRNDSVAGAGYTSQIGLAGSLLGRDHMLIELRHSDGLSSGDGPSRTLTLRYRNYF